MQSGVCKKSSWAHEKIEGIAGCAFGVAGEHGFGYKCAVPAPDAPADQKSSLPPRRRWPWWKRLLAGAGIFVLLLVIFYRPIVFTIIKVVAPKLAAKEHLKVDFDISGSIFTSLRIDNLHVTPTAPGPIEKANVGLLELHYSLLTLARHGLNSAFIESVTLHDVDAIYDPSKSPPPKPKKKEPFSLPPLPLPGKLSLRNVHFLMRPDTPEGAHATGQNVAASALVPAPASPAIAAATESAASQGLLVSGLTLELDPERNGELRVGELRIPGGPDLTNVSAATSYRDRDLRLTDATLAPEIHLRLLEINGSRLEQQFLDAAIDADRLLSGNASITLNIHGIDVPPDAKLALDINSLSLPTLLRFLKLDLPLSGSLDKFHVDYNGNTNQPKSWAGGMAIRAGGLAYGDATTAPIDQVALDATFDHGIVRLKDAGISQGGNRLAANAQVELAEKMENLVRSTGHGTLEIDAPDFTKLPVKLPQEIDGSLHAGGDFTLAGGKLATTLKARVRNLGLPAQKAVVSNIDLSLDTTKVLPADATAPPTAPGAPPPPHLPFYDRLQTHVAANGEGIAYADYRVDNVKLALSTDQANVKLETVEINRGPNKVNVDGTYVIPEDFANWQKQPLAADLSIALPDVSQFSADPQALPLKGLVTAKGQATAQNGVYGGGLDLQIRNLQAKGATIQTGDVVVAVENNRAVVKTGRIVLDDKNTIDLSGNAALAAPYPFEGGLTVDLSDLGKFNPILAANGTPDAALGGSLNIAGNVSGHLATAPNANDQKIDGTLDVTARNLQAKGAKIESVDTQVVVADNHATIKTGQIKIDPKSGITFGGNADLAAPHNFHGDLRREPARPWHVQFAARRASDCPPNPPRSTTAPNPPPPSRSWVGSFRLVTQARRTGSSPRTAPDKNDQDHQRHRGCQHRCARTSTAKGAKIENASTGNIAAANNQAVTIKTLHGASLDNKNSARRRPAMTATVGAIRLRRLNLNVNLLDLISPNSSRS